MPPVTISSCSLTANVMKSIMHLISSFTGVTNVRVKAILDSIHLHNLVLKPRDVTVQFFYFPFLLERFSQYSHSLISTRIR